MRILKTMHFLKRAGFVAATGTMLYAAGGCDVTNLINELMGLVLPA